MTRRRTLTAREVLDRAQTEAEFQGAIVALALRCGWKVYHTRFSWGSAPGFPDLVLVRRGEMVAWEVKAAKGVVSDDQAAWLGLLGAVPGIEARAVRPSDWDWVAERLQRSKEA